jgi:hypothetical protein
VPRFCVFDCKAAPRTTRTALAPSEMGASYFHTTSVGARQRAAARCHHSSLASNALDFQRRGSGPNEQMGGSHGVNKPRAGRRSKTPGGRCAARNHRQRAQQRATGSGQRATGSGRRATGSFEKRCFSHGVNKPRVGRRSKTHGERCASRNHRQRAQQRATGSGQRATGSGRRATGSFEKRCFSHGVNKPRVGRRSKTHGERCASRNHRQRAQPRATRDLRHPQVALHTDCPARTVEVGCFECCAVGRWSCGAHLPPGVFERRPARGLLTPCEPPICSLGPLLRR